MHLSSTLRRPLCPCSGRQNSFRTVSRVSSGLPRSSRVHSKGIDGEREGDGNDANGDDDGLKRSRWNDDVAKQPSTSSSSPPSDPTWTTGQAADAAYGWSDEFSSALLRRTCSSSSPSSSPPSTSNLITDIPLAKIRRPLARSRADDELKVAALAASMREHGQREPIDVLECPPGSGVYYGFSGCHRFAAARVLEWDTIRCRVRRVSEATLRMHLA